MADRKRILIADDDQDLLDMTSRDTEREAGLPRLSGALGTTR